MDGSVRGSGYKHCSKAETPLPARIQEKSRLQLPTLRRDWAYRGRPYHTREGSYQPPPPKNKPTRAVFI